MESSPKNWMNDEYKTKSLYTKDKGAPRKSTGGNFMKFRTKKREQWDLILSIILDNSEELSNNEMWMNVIYLPIKGSLYKSNREDLELLGWTVVETINKQYFLVPTALFILQ